MFSTCIALAQSYAAVCGFGLFFLPPGYLLASLLNFNQFRERSSAEKLLWSLCLSIPLTTELCVGLGRHLARPIVLVILLSLAFAAIALVITRSRKEASTAKRLPNSRATKIVVFLTGAIAVFYVLAVADIGFGHRLYISTVFTDWSVRVPMVAAAMRSGVPPVNALSALTGRAAPLRYFYFWNVVCADLAVLLHVPARESFTASCVWAMWSLLAVFFLSLKYLLGIRRDLRKHCALSFLVLGTIGLDILPTIPLYLVRKLHPYPEMEWWHQDRTPSILTTALYSPHHIAAFSTLLTALLVLALTLRDKQATNRPANYRTLLFASLFAGLCFGTAAGTSVFPTFTIAFVCLVWMVDLWRQRQFSTMTALALSGALALGIAHSFLHELLTTPAATLSDSSFVHLGWRNSAFVQYLLSKHLSALGQHILTKELLIQGGVLLLNLSDLGFFLFVLVHRIRRDREVTLSPTERLTWALFLGTAIPYFFVSSSSIASPNDLGLDAGILLRLILQLWAVPWMYALWQEAQGQRVFATRSAWRRGGLVLTGACLALGFCGEIFQVISERLYIPLIGSQAIPKQMDILTTDRLSERLYNIREGYRGLDQVPGAPAASATVQYNPIGPMQPALSFYSTHEIAAFDLGCGTGYGGDYALCNAVMPGLLNLFGNTLAGFIYGHAGNHRQDGAAPTVATAADALAACRTLHLSALIAESTDSIWSQPGSWVWTLSPVIANPTVRIFRCPVAKEERAGDSYVAFGLDIAGRKRRVRWACHECMSPLTRQGHGSF